MHAGNFYFINNSTGFLSGGAITDNSWFMKTTNGGINWVNLIGIPDIGPVEKVQFLNENTGYISGFGMLKTTNSGTNWLTVTLPAGSGVVQDFFFFNELTCIAGTGNSNFLKTTNGGINWTNTLLNRYTFNSNSGITSMSFNNELNGTVLLHNHMILVTSNGGINWLMLTSSMNPYTPLKSIEFLNENTALLGGWGTSDDYIIRKTTNGGLNWSGIYAYNYQTSSGYIYDIDFPSASTGFAVGGGSKGYVYKTTNAGDSWVKADSMGSGSNFAVEFINTQTGFVLGFNGEIFRTSNSGSNWSVFNSGVSFRLNSIHFINSLTGFTCGGDAIQKLLKTTDAGLNWSQVYSTTGSSFNHITFINTTTGLISAKGILKTTDGGVSWIQKIAGSTLPNFHRITFASLNIAYAYAAYGRFFKSTDAGETWGELPVPTDNFFSDIYFFNENTGYLIGDQGMILKTTNGGGNFYIGINGSNELLPSGFRLYQNYPNPFNPVTSIKFDLLKSSHVKITIYDILGREVLTLLNSNSSQGEHTVIWDASTFPSGVYFYEMTAGDFKEQRKMVLVK